MSYQDDKRKKTFHLWPQSGTPELFLRSSLLGFVTVGDTPKYAIAPERA